MKEFVSEAEALEYASKLGLKAVLFQGTLYDVADYLPTHPGGEDLLADELGTDIEEKFEEAEHTRAARKILEDMPKLGRVGGHSGSKAQHMGGGNLNSKFEFNYDRGLFWQMWNCDWGF